MSASKGCGGVHGRGVKLTKRKQQAVDSRFVYMRLLVTSRSCTETGNQAGRAGSLKWVAGIKDAIVDPRRTTWKSIRRR